MDKYEVALENYFEESLTIMEGSGLLDLVPDEITLKLNNRLTRVVGRCTMYSNDLYKIEFSRKIFEKYVDNNMHFEILNTLVHELCHALPDGMDHTGMWRVYADKVNQKYNLRISRLAEDDPVLKQVSKEMRSKIPHGDLTCVDCGHVYNVSMRTKAWNHTERFHCKCGGKLKK